jgi:predicted MFS family arabinose efflux permease
MPSPRDILYGPWRAVLVLGITQIIAWGTIFYSPVLTVPLIAAERGWSLAFAMGGFSLGLLVAGLISPYVGKSIDRHGGHAVMTIGSLTSALGLLGLVYAANPFAYLAVWMLLGAGLAASLYDPAFATLGRIFGAGARSPITILTLAGGFASTVGWPATHLLIGAVGWRGTYLVYAALLVLICAPLHFFALPRTRAVTEVKTDGKGATQPAHLVPQGAAFLLVVAAFASYAFVPSALSAHLLAIFGRTGIDAATVVLIGTLFGPAQVAARVCEFIFGRNLHPLTVARGAVSLLVGAFAMLAVFGFSVPTAAAFAVMFGAANGLITIVRGALPLALFGPIGYGRVIGRIAGPSLIMQAMAPFVLAFAIERASDPAALALAGCFVLIALSSFAAIRRPKA